MAITRGNKTTRADAIRKVQAGLTKHYANVNLTIAGTSYKPAALQTANRQPHGASSGDFRHPHGSTQSPG
jgi:hypothetical protein